MGGAGAVEMVQFLGSVETEVQVTGTTRMPGECISQLFILAQGLQSKRVTSVRPGFNLETASKNKA